MRRLELLAPARNADIGIAAIDCGADAVYIAAPRFGARQAAGNDISEIARLCSYAHTFGARIFVTLNTIIYDSELQEALDTLYAVQEAGADAIIVQDMAFIEMLREKHTANGRSHGAQGIDIPLHASTQCAIRTPEKARFLEKAGFSRLILERELSLEQIREISESVDCEVEFFVHGALCVCYSGQCYLSEKISGRSANRGACIQACRSRYDLIDNAGNILAKNKSLLSLKDYSLKDRIGDLAEAGVTSFKIEGRLKNISYVKNAVREYSMALDKFIARPENAGRFARASFGRITGGFTPDIGKTFNRGYTELFIDGKKGSWAAMDAAKSMGEEIGTVSGLNKSHTSFTVLPAKGRRGQEAGQRLLLSNGDGLSFISRNGEVTGVRADVCNGLTVQCKAAPELYNGARIFRNFNIAFEKSIESSPCRRLIDVRVTLSRSAETGSRPASCGQTLPFELKAYSEDGREAIVQIPSGTAAENQDRMKSMFSAQLSKTSGIYSFILEEIPDETILPHMPASAINAIRRTLSGQLDAMPCKAVPLYISGYIPLERDSASPAPGIEASMERNIEEHHSSGNQSIDYRANISNKMAEAFYARAGILMKEPAYELTHREDAELMRTKYCIRHELGICPKLNRASDNSPLFLMNNGRRLTLGFDCRNCEMTVSE